ncbi:hypothetical protein ACWGJB_01260 [Streptomyces sp. NPDC054813]
MDVDQVPDVHHLQPDAGHAGHRPGELDAGAADGTLKPDVDPEDVLLQLGVLWRIDPARGGAEARAARILRLIVDGLRVQQGPGGRPGGE